MKFKQWLEAGEIPTATLASGFGGGTGMINFGLRMDLKKRKRKLPPLSHLGTVNVEPDLPKFKFSR